jgi:hypothetical protein
MWDIYYVYRKNIASITTAIHRSAPMKLQGATSQKALNFILAAVRTWNLTHKHLYAVLPENWFK